MSEFMEQINFMLSKLIPEEINGKRIECKAVNNDDICFPERQEIRIKCRCYLLGIKITFKVSVVEKSIIEYSEYYYKQIERECEKMLIELTKQVIEKSEG